MVNASVSERGAWLLQWVRQASVPKGYGFGLGDGAPVGERWCDESSSSRSRWADWRRFALERRVRIVGMLRRRVKVKRVRKRIVRVDHGVVDGCVVGEAVGAMA